LDQHLEITIPAAALPIAGLMLVGVTQSVTSLSMDVEATGHAVTTLLFLLISFIIAASFFTSRERLFLLANVLTVFGTLVAGFALIQSLTWDGRLYWMRPTTAAVFGPFVNRNQFGGYMAMVLPIPLALILKMVRGQAQLLYGFAAAVMGTAIVVSGSRSGVIAMLASFILMSFLISRFRYSGPWRHVASTRSRLNTIGPIALVMITIIAGALWIGATPIVQRFGEAVDQLLQSGTPDASRATIWRDTVEIIRHHPIWGTGLGAYHTVYPTYAASQKLFGLDYAHNDYLQIMADAGIVGAILAVWFIIVLISAICRGMRSRDPLLSVLVLAAASAMFAIAVQTLSDTDLQVPSNALLFLILCSVVSHVAATAEERNGYAVILPAAIYPRYGVALTNRRWRRRVAPTK
jgi:O-antigen ligase